MMYETIADGMTALRERHAKEIEEMQRQLDLAAKLVPAGIAVPKRVQQNHRSEPWVIYSDMSCRDALALAESWIPYLAPELHAVESGCLYVGPTKEREGKERWAIEKAFMLDFSFDKFTLEWFAIIDGQTVRCQVTLKDWKHSRPYLRRIEEGYRRTRIEKTVPGLGESHRVVWGTGSDDYIRVTYYYSEDNHNAVLSLLEA
jgi:hypothetical protein